MKIKTIEKDYDEVKNLTPYTRKKPDKINWFFKNLLYFVSKPDLKKCNFSYTTEGLEKIGDKPCLILMNHSSFTDLEIVTQIMYPKPYNTVCTSDGFVGQEWLIRHLGCFPTNKFVTDVSLISDIRYILNELKSSVLMYPEASYSFDGTSTPLPRKMGIMLKRLNVPVMMIKTYGAFTRDPLYNCLQKRNVKVTAHAKCLFTPEELKEKSVTELDDILDNEFSFDNFLWQKENKVHTNEPFIADGLERILYKCPHCGKEGYMTGKGTELICNNCHKSYTMNSLGELVSKDNDTIYSHIPDWYKWEREEVKKELINGTYILEADVKIGMLVDFKAIYMVGEGHLTQTDKGFVLDGCNGRLHYEHPAGSSYSLYSDYYWYEIGDVICIGNNHCLYYCFPKNNIPVAKARLAAEESYKLIKSR